jgi:hypothetical protein
MRLRPRRCPRAFNAGSPGDFHQGPRDAVRSQRRLSQHRPTALAHASRISCAMSAAQLRRQQCSSGLGAAPEPHPGGQGDFRQGRETGRKLAQPRPTALAQASRISRARSAALTLLRVDRRKLHLEGIERLAANDAPSPQESSVLGSLSSRSGRQGDIASPPTLEAHAGASQVGALSLESRRPLSRTGRATFGQAARFSGVAPGPPQCIRGRALQGVRAGCRE